jgi:Domain of unknown function (DUF5666)
VLPISRMTIVRGRYFQALLLALLLLAWPAMPAVANNCTDGGRSRPDEGGVGGTGALPRAPDDEGGIGGTGISFDGDTGIIGTVTGFASICVGGVEVRYAGDTLVEIDGRRMAASDLAVGQVVEVIAYGAGSEVRAQHISVNHLVSGPVTSVDAPRNAIEVVGQTVQLSPATRAGGTDQEYSAVAAAFPLNSYVQVSGLRRSDGVVVASRVTSTETRDVVQLTGAVSTLDSGSLAIAGTPVQIADRIRPSVGEEVHIVGRWNGSAIIADAVEALPRIPFDGRVRRIDIEGYVRQSVAGQLQVGQFVVELPSAESHETLQPPAPDARIRIEAVVRDRRIIVEHMGVVGDLPALPPLPDREPRSGSGGGPNDAGHQGEPPPPRGQPNQDARRGQAPPPRPQGMVAPAAPDVGDAGPPSRPDRPDRPAPPQLPDRPQRPEPPPRPERPPIPDRPPHVERPEVRGRP